MEEKLLNESRELSKGIFWIRDDLPLEYSKDYCVLIPTDFDGNNIDNLTLYSKTGLTHNHEYYWNNIFDNKLKNGKKFDYYPRGRVEIRNNKVDVYLNPNINTNEIQIFIKQQFGLNGQGLKRITFHNDGSRHYKCHLD